jgi:hypothetical protein
MADDDAPPEDLEWSDTPNAETSEPEQPEQPDQQATPLEDLDWTSEPPNAARAAQPAERPQAPISSGAAEPDETQQPQERGKTDLLNLPSNVATGAAKGFAKGLREGSTVEDETPQEQQFRAQHPWIQGAVDLLNPGPLVRGAFGGIGGAIQGGVQAGAESLGVSPAEAEHGAKEMTDLAMTFAPMHSTGIPHVGSPTTGLVKTDNIGAGDPAVRAAMAGEQPSPGPMVKEGPTTPPNQQALEARQGGIPEPANENIPQATTPAPAPLAETPSTGAVHPMNDLERTTAETQPAANENVPPRTEPAMTAGERVGQEIEARENPENLEPFEPKSENLREGETRGQNENEPAMTQAERIRQEMEQNENPEGLEEWHPTPETAQEAVPQRGRTGRPIAGTRGGPENLEGAQAMARSKMGGTKTPEEVLKAIDERDAAAKKAIQDAHDAFDAEDAKRNIFKRGARAIFRPWRMLMSPEHLSARNTALHNKILGSQGEANYYRGQYDKATQPLVRAINRASPAARDEFLRRYNRGGLNPDNPLASGLDDARAVDKSYANRMAEYDPEHDFEDKILPSFFQDPEKAKQFIQDRRDLGHNGRMTLGEIMDGNDELGEIPIRKELNRVDGTTDPIRVLQKLHNSYDHFLEGKRILKQSLEDGTVSDVRRSPLDQRINNATIGGNDLYAEPETALMWNRYFNPNNIIDPTSGHFLDTLQRTKNMGTAYQLFGGAYHLLAETQEAVNGDIMRAISNAAGGRIDKAALNLAGAPFAPIRQATWTARKALKAYYDMEKAAKDDPRTHDAMSALISGGLSPKRVMRYNPDLVSAGKDWIKMLQDGAFKLEMKEKGQRIGQAFTRNGAMGLVKGPGQIVGEALKLASEGMQTAMHPLFQTYIPRLKLGAALNQMSDWMAANPEATPKQLQEIAKRINKSVDDRLGEMNQSTLFWNTALKRAANAIMISPSWEAGTLRAGYGGAKSLISNPASLAYKSGMKWQPNSSFPLAFLIGTAFTSTVATYLKTALQRGNISQGELPQSTSDLIWPHDVNGNQYIYPGYLKDFYSNYKGLIAGHKTIPGYITDSAYSKMSMVPQVLADFMRNKDWTDEGLPLWNPDDPDPKQKFNDFLEYFKANHMLPIGFQQAGKDQSDIGLSRAESFLGIKKRPNEGWEYAPLKNWEQQQKANAFRAKQQGKEYEKPEMPEDIKELKDQQNEERKEKRREKDKESGRSHHKKKDN